MLYAISVFLCFFLFYRLKNLIKTISDIGGASNWSKIRAEVIDARVTSDTFKINGFRSRHHFCSFFEVDGITYYCRRKSFFRSDRSVVGRMINKMNIGDFVDVYCDPERPYENVLLPPERHATARFYLETMVSFFSMAILSYIIIIKFI